ncbi:hypothetical protein VNI00_017136 [Paramarasmius palmivorus]|uniref:Transposase n=1 Tax=Paramarasmius palmivorus TaxID=297713 RepID=A0AAW0B6W5_9AGAR
MSFHSRKESHEAVPGEIRWEEPVVNHVELPPNPSQYLPANDASNLLSVTVDDPLEYLFDESCFDDRAGDFAAMTACKAAGNNSAMVEEMNTALEASESNVSQSPLVTDDIDTGGNPPDFLLSSTFPPSTTPFNNRSASNDNIDIGNPTIGEAEKKLRGKSNQEKLNEMILALLQHEIEQVMLIAKDTGYSIQHVKKTLGTLRPRTEAKRPSAYNAAFAIKAQEVNQGRSPGQKLTASEIHALVKEDSELMKMIEDPVAAQDMIDEAMEIRHERLTHVHSSSQAASTDCTRHVNRWQLESKNLHHRTGASVLCVVTKGQYGTTIQGSYSGQGPIDDFLQDVFGVSIAYFSWMLEGYSCLWSKKRGHALMTAEMRTSLGTMINKGARHITGYNVRRILFPYYESECERQRVHIAHWPADIPLVAPSNLDTKQVQKLYASWKSGCTRWERMSLSDYKSLKSKLQARRNAGEVVDPPKRAQRSDKGSIHKKRKRNDSDTFEYMQAKRQKPAVVGMPSMAVNPKKQAKLIQASSNSNIGRKSATKPGTRKGKHGRPAGTNKASGKQAKKQKEADNMEDSGDSDKEIDLNDRSSFDDDDMSVDDDDDNNSVDVDDDMSVDDDDNVGEDFSDGDGEEEIDELEE